MPWIDRYRNRRGLDIEFTYEPVLKRPVVRITNTSTAAAHVDAIDVEAGKRVIGGWRPLAETGTIAAGEAWTFRIERQGDHNRAAEPDYVLIRHGAKKRFRVAISQSARAKQIAMRVTIGAAAVALLVLAGKVFCAPRLACRDDLAAPKSGSTWQPPASTTTRYISGRFAIAVSNPLGTTVVRNPRPYDVADVRIEVDAERIAAPMTTHLALCADFKIPTAITSSWSRAQETTSSASKLVPALRTRA